MTKFSVLLSLYAKADPRHLSEALCSIWSSQTVKPDEIVVVKDGPLTKALDMEIEKWKKELGEVLAIVLLRKCSGLGVALGLGLEACSYDIVARMDADDIARCDRFEKQINFLEQKPEVDIVGSVITEFQHDPTVVLSTRNVPLRHEQILRLAKIRNPLNHVSVMLRKHAVLCAGNYRSSWCMEDYDLWVRMLLNGAIAANIGEPLVNVRAGNSMLARRRGFKYFKEEYKRQMVFYDIGFLSSFELLRNLLIRMPVRLLPTPILKLVYGLIRAQRVTST